MLPNSVQLELKH